MKQPAPGTCLPTSLAILAGKPVDEVLTMMGRYILPPRLVEHGWTDIELIYAAHELGIALTPFFEGGSWAFRALYEKYDGILLGMLNDPPPGQIAGHAVAKKDGYLIDPTWGTRSHIFGYPFERLHSRIFYAWTRMH